MATCTLAVGTPDTGATPNTSGTFTPAVGDLLVVFVVVSDTATGNAGSDALTSSAGLTFARITEAGYGTGGIHHVTVFVANSLVASATVQSVTFDNASDAGTGTIIFVFRVAGMTLTGLSAVKQSARVQAQAAATTPAPVFASAVDTANPTLGCVGNSTNPAGLTAPTGWTEPASGDLGYNTPATGGQVVFRNSGFSGTTVTWGSASASLNAAIVLELDAGTGGYTLAADAGTFSYAGQAANLLRSLVLGADAGTFSYTGNNAGLAKGFRLTADAGAFSYSGGDAFFSRTYALPADAGSFSYSGSAANLLKGHRLAADAGTFSYAGNDTNLLRGWSLNAETGAFIYTGHDATFIYTPIGGYTLTADGGSFSYVGDAANLLKGWRLPADAGAYSYVGQDAGLLRGLRLAADTGAFAYTGQAVNLLKGWRIAADHGAFTYSGNNASLFKTGSYALAADAGVFSYTGNNATLIYTPVGSYVLTANGGVFSYTGSDASLSKAWRLLAETGVFSYTGHDATLVRDRRLTADAGAFSYTGAAAAFQWVRRLLADGATFSYIGGQAVLIHAGFVFPLPAPLTMQLDRNERSMTLNADESAAILDALEASMTLD